MTQEKRISVPRLLKLSINLLYYGGFAILLLSIVLFFQTAFTLKGNNIKADMSFSCLAKMDTVFPVALPFELEPDKMLDLFNLSEVSSDVEGVPSDENGQSSLLKAGKSTGPKLLRVRQDELRLQLTGIDKILLNQISIYSIFKAVCFFLIVLNLRNFFRTVEQKRPFVHENTVRIRRIGEVVTVYGPLTAGLDMMIGTRVKKFLPNPESILDLEVSFHIELVIIGLIILVIAQIFSLGVRLQHDSDLTV